MKNTTLIDGGAVAGVSLSAFEPVVASHFAVAVRLHGGDLNGLNGVAGGAGRGMWRGQPSLGIGTSAGMRAGTWAGTSAANATVPAAPAAPAAPARQLGRRNSKQFGSKQFRTAYEGPRPWKVPV
jgi:hypothetical protein